MEPLSGVQTWLYDNLPVGVAILDRQLIYRYTNASYAAIQGYTAAQLQGQSLEKGQRDWQELISGMAERARNTHRAVETFDVTLTYPRQPSLVRTWDVTVLPVFREEEVDVFVIYLVDVTSRQQAEELSASELRLRSILETAIDAIFVIDETGRILRANPATGRIFGYDTQELVGKPIETIMPSPYHENHPRYMERYLHTEIPHIIGTVREVRGRRKDGTIFPCELSVAESREGRERRVFVGIIRDITDRKQAEEAVERLYRQFQLLLDAAGEGIFGLDREGIITFINPSAAAMAGYTAEEMIGQPAHQLLHHTRADGTPYPESECPINAAYLDGLTHRVTDEVFWRKDGASFPVEYISTPIHEHGQLAGAVVTFNDITARKRLEADLESSRARLEAILDTVPLPLFVIEPDGHISLATEAAREFYGDILAHGQVLKMTRLHPDTRAPWPVEDWPVVRALRDGRLYSNVEQLIVFPDGHEVPVLVHAAPVIVDGKVIAAVGVLQDLTQLKAADRAKDAFLALISHELRSPLATIISWADLAQEDETLRAEALQVILRNAHAQQRIIRDLLDLSRVVYGKLTLEKEPIDAWETASRIAEGMRARIEDQELYLVLEPPGEPLPILADPVRVGQIISNLLTNATKFTPAGGTITLAGAREGDMARLSVSDTGRGIPPEQLPNVFQRFQQLGRERTSGGLGLGLAIVKGLVELHGGRVAVSSPGLDQGSTFTVWFPLRKDGEER